MLHEPQIIMKHLIIITGNISGDFRAEWRNYGEKALRWIIWFNCFLEPHTPAP